MVSLCTWSLWLVFPGMAECLAQEGTGRRYRSGADSLFQAYFEKHPRRAMDSNPFRFGLPPGEWQVYRQDSVRLRQSIACLEAGQTREAVRLLLRQAVHEKGVISNASEWYLALGYLRLGNTARASFLFHKIAETEVHPYQDDAEVIYQYLLKQGMP